MKFLNLSQKIRKPARLTLFLVLILTLLVLSLVSYFSYRKCHPNLIKDGVRYTQNICSETYKKAASPQRNPNEKLIMAKVYNNSEANYWEIMDNSQSPPFPTGIKIFENNLSSPTIVRWHNFLLGVNIEHYIEKSSGAYLGSNELDRYNLQSQIRSIRAYNIDTRETFDISLDKPIWGEIQSLASQIIDNSFYFGAGGFFGPSLGYKLTLPPQRNSRITKLSQGLGNKVEKFGNVYISSFCYEGCEYSLLNIANTTETPLLRLNNASNGRNADRKEEFIGIDSQGRMILNVYTSTLETNQTQQLETAMIAAVPLNNEKTTIPLLETTDLPAKITGYFMINGLDKVLMIAESNVYIYDLKENKIRTIEIGTKLKNYLKADSYPSNLYSPKSDKAICFIDKPSMGTAIDLTTETYLDPMPDDCDEKETSDETFKRLALPDNFELIYIPTTYRTHNVINVPESELPKNAEIIK